MRICKTSGVKSASVKGRNVDTNNGRRKWK